MSYDDEAVDPRRDLAEIEMPTTYTGEVIQGASTLGDPVFVQLDNVDEEDDDDISPTPQRVGPCSYSPRGVDLPKVGDRVLVAFSDNGEPWLAEWVPTVPTPLASGASVEQWFTGSGAPAGGLGAINDWYLDSVSGNYYEKTGASSWTLRGNLKGPPGTDGADGATGSTGATGTPGEQWFTGGGAPSGGLGVINDWYLDSVTGDYYEKTGPTTWTLRGNLKGPAGASASGGAAATGTYSTNVGNGVATSFTVTHNFASRNVGVAVFHSSAPYDEVFPDVERTNLNDITVRFLAPPASNEYTVLVWTGALNTYVHTQVAPSATWSINHGRGGFPSVTVIDSGGSTILPEITYVDNMNLNVVFGSATSGKAYLN
jgi:hypothetical protein